MSEVQLFRRSVMAGSEPEERDSCPICGVDLRYEVDGRTYSHVVGVEVRGMYDGILYWQCPTCGGRWHRFGEGHPLRERADRYVNPA